MNNTNKKKRIYQLIQLSDNNEVVLDIKLLSLVMFLIIASNLLTYQFFGLEQSMLTYDYENMESLYLLEKASVFVQDVYGFELKVREVSGELAVPPEWLMAVMYSESKFNAQIKNHNSGATGLIQWMPATAKDLDTNVKTLAQMPHTEQLDYVFKYLDRVRKKYGEFKNLTDLYLAILYPRAIEGEYCYTLYAHPSKAYEQNLILDENKDKQVTVKDIDMRMKRMFPTAYLIDKDKA